MPSGPQPVDTGTLRATLRERAWSMPVVANARNTWRQRKGLLLELRTDDGLVGMGEASPLPGYSRESLAEARSELEAWVVREPRLPESIAGVGEALRAPRDAPWKAPAARFAAETALFELLAKRRGRRIEEELCAVAPVGGWADPGIAALVSGLDPRSTIHELEEQGAEGGERRVKVKVGRAGQWQEELALLGALVDHFGDRLHLRLDANRAFDPAEAPQRLGQLVDFAPEWIEEPVPTAALFDDQTFAEPPAIPLALDESLSAEGGGWSRAEPRLRQLRIAAVVLKPGMLGGLGPSLELGRRARARGLATVVSHLFEGPIAFEAARCLARVLDAESPLVDEAHGLAPHGGLAAAGKAR